MIANALKKRLEADIELARSDLEVFLNNPIGVAEHIDYVATAEKKLDILAHAEDKLESLIKHFNNY